MKKLALAIAGAALAAGLSMSSAQAAPGGLAPLKGVTTSSDTLVQKTHGWHSYCATSRRGWRHRHVRRGTVSCGPRWRKTRHCYFNRRGVRVCVFR